MMGILVFSQNSPLLCRVPACLSYKNGTSPPSLSYCYSLCFFVVLVTLQKSIFVCLLVCSFSQQKVSSMRVDALSYCTSPYSQRLKQYLIHARISVSVRWLDAQMGEWMDRRMDEFHLGLLRLLHSVFQTFSKYSNAVLSVTEPSFSPPQSKPISTQHITAL